MFSAKIIPNTNKFLFSATSRNFLNIFGKEKPTETQAIAKVESKKQMNAFKPIQRQSAPRELTEAEKYYLEYRREREKSEQEFIKRQREIEELSDRVRREAEISLQMVDYKSIIISNFNILPDSDFKSVQEFQGYLESINFENKRLTEENCVKLIKGFLTFADKLTLDYIQRPSFISFQTNLAMSLSYFKVPHNFSLIAKFLDLFCLDSDDLWSNLETQVQTKMEFMDYNDLVSILVHFSNQNEGTPKFYDSLEKCFSDKLKLLTTAQLVDIFVGYFNHRMGSRPFVEKILKRLKEKFDDDLLVPEMCDLVKLTLILPEISDDYDLIRTEVYKSIERNVIDSKEKLNFKTCCYLAKGFGFDHGSADLFQIFNAITMAKLEEATLENMMNYVAGFLFTYRVSPEALSIVLTKLDHFMPSISPGNLAKIVKALYILEQEKLPIVKRIESLLIQILRESVQDISKEELFEITFSYCLTRIGSREFYRTLEIALVSRLEELALDKQLFENFIDVYEKSGLCSNSFIYRMRRLN
jgi:hypothetical protein